MTSKCGGITVSRALRKMAFLVREQKKNQKLPFCAKSRVLVTLKCSPSFKKWQILHKNKNYKFEDFIAHQKGLLGT